MEDPRRVLPIAEERLDELTREIVWGAQKFSSFFRQRRVISGLECVSFVRVLVLALFDLLCSVQNLKNDDQIYIVILFNRGTRTKFIRTNKRN